MPIGEVMIGAALGITLQVLYEAIIKAKDKSLATKCILGRLGATISRITPLVVHVDKISEKVEYSQRKVIEDLKRLLEKAVFLVEAYAELRRRNLHKKHRYKSRIKELEASLRWMVDVDVQVDQCLDIKELMAKMSEMNTKLDKITCQPTDCNCFKSNDSTSPVISQTSNQNILEATDGSSEENEEESSRIDIHLRWSSRKKAKDREIRFVVK
ncbi:RPW8-like protein 3 [Raphanus sativus]|uniref:RPW8-like protein 3 n=1 Tax=Raphanus sativus TaxID=3726 RepID=A0A6J0JQC8_RAPSA|nr:RPW8-like protein 3 [Raphanus sativus]